MGSGVIAEVDFGVMDFTVSGLIGRLNKFMLNSVFVFRVERMRRREFSA
jgi:hypothetical protein